MKIVPEVNFRFRDVCGVVCSVIQLCFHFIPVFLGVTNLQAKHVEMTSLCAHWQVHRHATAYRVVIESLQGKYNPSLMFLSSICVFGSLHTTVYNTQVALDNSPLVEEAICTGQSCCIWSLTGWVSELLTLCKPPFSLSGNGYNHSADFLEFCEDKTEIFHRKHLQQCSEGPQKC